MVTRGLLLILLSPFEVDGAVTLRPGKPVGCLSLGFILVEAVMAPVSASELGRLNIELRGRDFWIGLGPKEAFIIYPSSSYSSTSIFIGLLALAILILPILSGVGLSRISDMFGILMNEGNLLSGQILFPLLFPLTVELFLPHYLVSAGVFPGDFLGKETLSSLSHKLFLEIILFSVAVFLRV